jgi:hypothetical protein
MASRIVCSRMPGPLSLTVTPSSFRVTVISGVRPVLAVPFSQASRALATSSLIRATGQSSRA